MQCKYNSPTLLYLITCPRYDARQKYFPNPTLSSIHAESDHYCEDKIFRFLKNNMIHLI